jgi:D-glycero-alpha-D-manno-heptose-7-phosphate kinase
VIITRTPFRVSLMGGGTDYPTWYREHGGAVLGFTIDKYCYIFVRRLPPFFTHKHRIVYSQIELVRAVEEINHPAVRAVMSECSRELSGGLEIQHMGDLPARSGLGSSSSFTVGLINALHAMRGKMISPKALADEAIRIEQEVMKEAVGSQDQVWAAFGGLAKINFPPTGDIQYTPLVMSRERAERLNGSLMLFFTGLSRFASSVAAEQISNMNEKEKQLRAMRRMVDECADILQLDYRNLDDLGSLLDEAWQIKRQLASKVSSSTIDEIYAAGIEAGALGGKLLGAGGGGFMLFYVPPHAQPQIRERLRDFIEVNFTINSPGSSVVLYEPDRLG